MKYLSEIFEINDITENLKEQAQKTYLSAKERMNQLPISFSEDTELMLSNHLMALIKRILEKKLIDPIEEEMMKEVSPEAWGYAWELAEPLFAEYGMEMDRSEIFLVGTYMEIAIASAVVV